MKDSDGEEGKDLKRGPLPSLQGSGRISHEAVSGEQTWGKGQFSARGEVAAGQREERALCLRALLAKLVLWPLLL